MDKATVAALTSGGRFIDEGSGSFTFVNHSSRKYVSVSFAVWKEGVELLSVKAGLRGSSGHCPSPLGQLYPDLNQAYIAAYNFAKTLLKG